MINMPGRQQKAQPADSAPLKPQPIRLGVWGPPNSGKTVYMSMLHHYLMDPEYSPWKIELTDQDTIDFVRNNLHNIRTKGEFVDPTNPMENNIQKIYTYKLVNKVEKKMIIELKFFDLAGEYYLSSDRTKEFRNEENRKLSVAQHLNSCHGILFLLSPLEEDKPHLKDLSYHDLLEHLFMSMQYTRGPSISGELEQYAAFCITKSDHKDVYDDFSHSSPSQSFFKLLGTNSSVNLIQNFFKIELNTRDREAVQQPTASNRCRFFYVSPFGVYQNKDNIYTSPVEEISSDQADPVATSKVPQSPFVQNLRSQSDPYANKTKILSEDRLKIKSLKFYRINTEVKFEPINMIKPIEWLIEGISTCYPSLPPLPEVQVNENQGEAV